MRNAALNQPIQTQMQSQHPPRSPPVGASCEVLAGPGARGRLEVKEGRPRRAESSASSKLADKRCSWEEPLGTRVRRDRQATSRLKTKVTLQGEKKNFYSHASFLCLFVWGGRSPSLSVPSSARPRLKVLLSGNADGLSEVSALDVSHMPTDRRPDLEFSICVIVFELFGGLLLGGFWDCSPASAATSLEAWRFSPSAFLPNIPRLPIMPRCSRNWSMRPFSWGLGSGWELDVNGTPVNGSLGALPHVASLFWCSSSVVLSTDTPLGSSMGSSITSWVIGSRNSSGIDVSLETK